MKSFFEAIESLFDKLLLPLDFFRFSDSWWGANAINFIFIIIGFLAITYWLKQLKIFENNNEEDKSSTSHTYL